MPAVRVAADGVEPVVLRMSQFAGAVLSRMRDRLEHVSDSRPMSRMQSSVDMDVVFAVR